MLGRREMRKAQEKKSEREEMGRGASTVVLTNHTYLLNWDKTTFECFKVINNPPLGVGCEWVGIKVEEGNALKPLRRGCGWGVPRGSEHTLCWHYHLSKHCRFIGNHSYGGHILSGSKTIGTIKVCNWSLQPLFNAWNHPSGSFDF